MFFPLKARSNYQMREREELREILPIFFAPTKTQLVGASKTICVTNRAMTMLILNCGLFGLDHLRASWEWQPPHLQPDEHAMQRIRSGTKAEQLREIRKITRIFDERRLFTGHLFWNGPRWHLLFFDQRDRAKQDNRWKFGPHIHFLNFLVRPKTSLYDIMRELNTERPHLKSAIHICYHEVTSAQLKAESDEDCRRESRTGCQSQC